MPGDDTEDVDFSVITRAIRCGGSMVEQLVNGVHYGTSEVRCLLLDECDLIIECKVCRNLFRALPNFIAHKRVYCLEAFQGPNEVSVPLTQHSHNVDTVVVEPVAPENGNNHDVQQLQPTDTLANTIQQMQNGTFEGKSDAYKFYTDVADKVDRIAQNTQTQFIKHEVIPGNSNAVLVSVVESDQLDFTDEITTKEIQDVTEEMVSDSEEVIEDSAKSFGVNLQDELNASTNKSPERPEGIIRSARLRAKSEKCQILQETVKTPAKKETKPNVANSASGGHKLREKAKKMFLYPVRKAVTDAKDCDLKALRCLICNRKFSSSKCLHYHMKIHSNKRQVFPCPLCSTVLKHKWGLTRHLMRSHALPKNQVDKIHQELKKLAEESNKSESPEAIEKNKTQNKESNSIIRDSPLVNVSSQGRTRTNSALEKKAKFLVDSAKADSMPKSAKKSQGEPDLVTGPNDRPKKEFSVKFCSRTNSKSAQFYSGLSLLHCKMCSKAFAKKESLQAHSRVCSLAVNNVSNNDNGHRRQVVNRRQRLGPSKVEQEDVVQKSATVKGEAAEQNETVITEEISGTTTNGQGKGKKETVLIEAEADIKIISNVCPISPVKVILEHCDVPKLRRTDIEAESPRLRSLQQQESVENPAHKKQSRRPNGTFKKAQKSTDVNHKIKSACVRESKIIDSPETSTPKKEKVTTTNVKEELQHQGDEIFPTSLGTRQRHKATNNQHSEVDYINEDFNNSTEMITKNRMSKRQASINKRRTVSEGSAELAAKKIAGVGTSDEVHMNNSLGSTSVDLESNDNGPDMEVSLISDNELLDMQKRLEAQLGQQISEVSQELRAKGRQQGSALETIRSVEEIWVGKSPGKPAEKLKSSRTYVLDTSNNKNRNNKRGRPYCQDSKRVDLLIDEKNLKCLECGELFGSVSNMRRHAIRHLGWQRYRCKLCSSYCSYHKSEMKSHLVRVHASTVGNCNYFLRYCIIDLGKEGSRRRAQKRQRTMSNRQAARAGEAAKSSRSLALTGMVPTNSDTADISTDNLGKDEKMSAINVNDMADPDPKRFNISTRNSPRVFDIRPLKRAGTETLIGRKSVHCKQGKQSIESSESAPIQVPNTCSVSSGESRPSTPTVSKSKTRSIDFCKTRNVDNPWIDGFYKRLSGGSLGALRKEQMMVRPFKNSTGESVQSETSSTASISSDNVNSKNSPGKSTDKNSPRPAKSDSSLQNATSSACTNLTMTLQSDEGQSG